MRDLSRGIVFERSDGRMALVLSKEIYQKEAVLQAAHKFTDLCHILIEPAGDKSVGVYFQLQSDVDGNLEEIALDFCNEVLDQQVRLDLEREYGPLRQLIVRQAFAPGTRSTAASEPKG